jgi:hypothetical protein
MPRSASRQKLPKFILLSLHLAFTWPGLWQAFPFGVLMLPGTVHFIEVPLSTSFFIFFFKSLVHNSDILVALQKSFFFFL